MIKPGLSILTDDAELSWDSGAEEKQHIAQDGLLSTTLRLSARLSAIWLPARNEIDASDNAKTQ